MNEKQVLPLPILIILIMGFSGVALFCLYVVHTVVKSIPPNFAMPWYLNIVPVIMVAVSFVMLLWIKKYNKNPEIVNSTKINDVKK